MYFFVNLWKSILSYACINLIKTAKYGQQWRTSLKDTPPSLLHSAALKFYVSKLANTCSYTIHIRYYRARFSRKSMLLWLHFQTFCVLSCKFSMRTAYYIWPTLDKIVMNRDTIPVWHKRKSVIIIQGFWMQMQ